MVSTVGDCKMSGHISYIQQVEVNYWNLRIEAVPTQPPDEPDCFRYDNIDTVRKGRQRRTLAYNEQATGKPAFGGHASE